MRSDSLRVLCLSWVPKEHEMANQMIPEYLNMSHNVIMKNSGGDITRKAADNFGDIECPFCDFVLAPEKTILKTGQRCKRCNAFVDDLEPW